MLSVIAKTKVEESAGLDLDAKPGSDLDPSELWPLASKLPRQGKVMQGQQKVPPRPLVTKKVVSVGGGQNQETPETKECNVRNCLILYRYHQLPEEPLLKWIMRVANLGALSLVLSAAEWKSVFGLTQNPQLTMEQSQMSVHELTYRRLLPKGTL